MPRLREQSAHHIMDTRSAAAYIGKPHRTLEQWRYQGKGPAFVKVGHAVRYRRRDLDAWLDANTVHPGAA